MDNTYTKTENESHEENSTESGESGERAGNCNRSISEVGAEAAKQTNSDANKTCTSLISDTGKCPYCLQTPCVVLGRVRPRGRPLPTNHAKRLKEYRLFYRSLKKQGLWTNITYLERKQELGCHISDVREVMPLCVVEDVRRRWANPPHIPYMGHRCA